MSIEITCWSTSRSITFPPCLSISFLLMLNIVNISHFQTSPSSLLRGTGYRKDIEREITLLWCKVMAMHWAFLRAKQCSDA